MSTPAPAPAPALAVGAPPAVGFRSLTVLGITAFAFAIALIGVVWGGLNFPENAPEEQIYCALTLIDLGVGFAIATTGAIIASRIKLPLKRRSPATIVGISLVGLAFAGWILLSGIGIVLHTVTVQTPHYADDVAGAVYFGIPWIAGTVLCAFGYRRGGTRANTVLALVGVTVGLLIVLSTLVSAVAYGLGLTT